MDRNRLFFAAALLVAFSGCAHTSVKKAEPETLKMSTGLRHIAGPILSTSNIIKPSAKALNESLLIELTFHSLEKFPKGALEIAGPKTRLVANTDKLWLPTTSSLAGLRSKRVDNPEGELDLFNSQYGRNRQFPTLESVAPKGVTVAFDLTRSTNEASLKWNEPEHRWTVLVHRHGKNRDLISIALEAPGNAAEASFPVTETLIFEDMEGPNLGFLILLPGPIDESSLSLAVTLTLRSPPAPGDPSFRSFRRRVARCKKDLVDLELDEVTDQRRSAPRSVDFSKYLIEGLTKASKQRIVLSSLADDLQASLVGEIALAGEDPVVRDLASKTLRLIRSMPATASPEEWAWELEKQALTVLETRWIEDKLSMGLRAVFANYAGALAWQTSLFIELADDCRDLNELQIGIRAKNKELLDDASPNIRLQAYEWLKSRGLAPKDYDPLKKEKETALKLRAAKEGKK